MIATGKKNAIMIVIIAYASTAIAHGGATGIILERMNAMSSLSAVKNYVSTAISSGAEINFKDMKGQAAVMNTALVVLEDRFPEGAMSNASEASPAIWEKPEDWAREVDKLSAAVADFTKAAQDSDPEMLAKAFDDFSKTCKSCHQEFRVEKL